MQDVRDKRVTVAGLGHFGGNIAAVRWLVEQGADVLVTDAAPPEKLTDSLEQLQGLPVRLRIGEHHEEDFTATDLIVASPAIPPRNRYLSAARAAGVPVTTEIRLFVERCPATVLGVTGTKGKSTTSAMLERMLKTRYATWLGGNIGGSLLGELTRIEKTHLVVLELSSYMLHYLGEMKWSPHVGVVTLLATDHVEWHGSAEAYLEAKKNLLRFQRPDDFAVLSRDAAAQAALASVTAGRVVTYPVGDGRPFDLSVPGRHNQLNAQAAYAAASILGVSRDEAQAAMREFPGLPHRLQLVHEAGGVRYFNDSIATIPDAAVAALQSFPPRRVIQIVGGSDKKLPLTAMCAALRERAKAVLCIGKLGPAIADLMAESAGQASAPAYRCGDLATAMKMAKTVASPGDVVLLSPGCASHDQFRNFEERGEMFARLAKEMQNAE